MVTLVTKVVPALGTEVVRAGARDGGARDDARDGDAGEDM
jgi:hypothetical protein